MTLDPMTLEDAYRRIAELDDPAVVVSLLDRSEIVARPGGALGGMPVLVKDNIALRGVPTAAACPAYASGVAVVSAAIVTGLEAAGATVIGTTNMDQFATGLVGTRSPHGTPRNPLAPGYIPGGSSSGAGVAVARGLVPLAIGTDTAGSGRVPAACTGTVGLKPTRGLVSTVGIIPAVASLDCVSFHARDVRTAWDAFVAVADESARADVRRRGPGREPARVGRVAAAVIARECEPDVADAYERTCATLGATVTVDMEPFFAAGRLLYGPFVAARVAAFGAFVAERPDAVEPVVASIVNGARGITGAEVFAGYAAVDQLAAEAAAQWAGVDVLVVPTMPFFPTVAEVATDPLGCNARLGRFTDFVNVLDCCAIAVPGAHRTDGLPFGISVIGRAGSDALVASIAAGTEEPLSGMGGPARLAVVGAHLDGLPLHHELTRLSARLVAVTETAPAYSLYALADTVPPKPGLVRAEPGAPIACEVYALGAAELATFLADVAAPLAIGPVELADGTWVPGFLAAAGATDGGIDVTAYGGWRAYVMDRVLT